MADDGAQPRRIDTDALRETSGLAASTRDADLLWAHNDSGDFATLYALRRDGRYLGAVDVLDARALDWEDMAAFERDGTHWLLVADTGDNLGIRATVSLYLLPEPDTRGLTPDSLAEARASRRIQLRFAGGPRDVEAAAVDPAAGVVYLISKREQPPALYRVSLQAGPSDAPATAEKIAELTGLRQSGGPRIRPTGLDISADGRRWLITASGQALIYDRQPGQPLAEMLAAAPRVIELPALAQLEAGALNAAGTTGYFIPESQPARLVVRALDAP